LVFFFSFFFRLLRKGFGFLAKELDVAAEAVGLASVVLEGALRKLLHAEGAHKVLRVEALANGGDAPAEHWLLTRGAERPALGVIMLLAVRLALVVEEAASSKALLALLQRGK